MSGDYTRFTFDPTKVFSGVHKQQGRVSLDADFNEFEEILDRRDRSEMYDTVGHAVVPATTPDGFKIAVDAAAKVTIGTGRMYVDGIQAECFGDMSDPKKTVFDAAIGNLVGPLPLPFDAQPFHYPTAFPAISPTTGVINLVYLDVWHREVTSWEDIRLLDPALAGADTATRVQTAWQVKALSPVAADACDNPPQTWVDLTAPSTARMTAAASTTPPPMGPCVIQSAGGYSGRENRLYRVEIHKGGKLTGASPATFKWSRDNASFVASVEKINPSGADSIIIVESIGRDTWTQFEVDQKIELLDDTVEFALREKNVGGTVAKIKNVNHATREITIDQNLSAFPIIATRHPRIRRWDTALPADPAIRNVTNGTAIALEDGIAISFGDGTLAHANDTLHAGDYWVFSARTADGSIDVVDNAPPRGILHHFTPLAIVTSGAPPVVNQDCRDPWPVPCDCEGGGCECDACVSLESHLSGALTIHDAVAKVIAMGGGTVCIGIGVFPLGDQWIDISKAVSVVVKGKGLATILQYAGTGGAIRIGPAAFDITVRDLSLITDRFGDAPHDAIEVSGAALVTLEHLTVIEDPIAVIGFLDQGGSIRPAGGAVGLVGFVLRATVRDCNLAGGGGVVSRSALNNEPDDYLVAADLTIEHNLVLATTYGVAFGLPQLPGTTALADRTAIRSCSIFGCEEAGIQVAAKVVAGETLVEDNTMAVRGRGITIATDRMSVLDNRIASYDRGRGVSGVALVRGDSDIVADVRVDGNLIDGFGDAGVEITTFVTGLVVSENAVTDCGQGIVMTLESRGAAVRIVNNRLIDIGAVRSGRPWVFGIVLVATIDGQVLDNTVTRVAQEDASAVWRAGIQAIACGSLRIAGNTVSDIGPVEFGGVSVGIASTIGFDRLDILDNAVRPGEQRILGTWLALLIGGGDDPWGNSIAGIGHAYVWLSGWVTMVGSRERPSEAAVRGNHLDSIGKAQTVVIMTPGSCTFSDNWCRQLMRNGTAVVVIGAEGAQLTALTLATNQVRQDPQDDAVAIDAWVGPAVFPPPGIGATVLANITDGVIMLDGNPITPPWRSLNVRLS